MSGRDGDVDHRHAGRLPAPGHRLPVGKARLHHGGSAGRRASSVTSAPVVPFTLASVCQQASGLLVVSLIDRQIDR